MAIPAVWPTPNNPDTRVRVFRLEIERSLTASPVITFHLQEAITVGNKDFIEYRPDLALSISLETALQDETLAPLVALIAPNLEELSYILYQRKFTELTAPIIPPVV